MIFDTLDHIDIYEGIHPGVMQGLRLLRSLDFDSLEDGSYEVEGERLFYSLATYETKQDNQTPETHRRYIDIQYMVRGEELVGLCRQDELTGVVEAYPERDIWLNRGRTDRMRLTQGSFMVLWPSDPHAPGIAAGEGSALCRKCVMKVLADW